MARKGQQHEVYDFNVGRFSGGRKESEGAGALPSSASFGLFSI
jgi:hypothetical protein